MPVGKSKAASPTLPTIRARRTPAQAPGDHQMDDEEEVVLEAEDDALAEPAERDDRATDDGGDRWIDGAQEERAREAHRLERLAENARREALEVQLDVGVLRHDREDPTRGRR